MRPHSLRIGAIPALLMGQYRLVTLDPCHFHAGQIQKEAQADLCNPTQWKLHLYAGWDWFEPMFADRPTAKYFVTTQGVAPARRQTI